MIDIANPLGKIDALHAKVEKSSKSEEARLKEACQGFETLFFQQMFKAMRASENENTLIPKSNGEKIFTELLDEQYSEIAAKNSVNGLADIMFEQLKGTLLNADTAEKELEMRKSIVSGR